MDDQPRQASTVAAASETGREKRYVIRLKSEVDFLRGQVAIKDA